jgi:hypothetical protein
MTRTELLAARDDLRDAEVLLLRSVREGTAAERLEAEARYLSLHERVYGPAKAYALSKGRAPAATPSPPPTVPGRSGGPTRRVR